MENCVSDGSKKLCIRLCTVIGDNIELLPHFIEHYRNLGVDKFHIILHADAGKEHFLAEAIEILKINDILPEQIFTGMWNSCNSTNLINNCTAKHNSDWFIIADSDEFQIYKSPLREVISHAERIGQDYITGCFVDRISEDGRLHAPNNIDSLWHQFPYAGFISFPLSGALPYKITVCKGSVKLTQGQHGVYQEGNKWPVTSKVEVQVHHFKWNNNLLANLKSRTESFAKVQDQLHPIDVTYQSECISVLNYFKQYGRLDMSNKAFLLAKSGSTFDKYIYWELVLKRVMTWASLQASPRIQINDNKHLI